MARCLLTGAAGFIGTHVLAALRVAGHDVLGIDSFVPQVHAGRYGRKNLLTTTVGHYAGLWEQAPDRGGEIDTVIHLAAAVGVGQSQYQPAHYVEQNALETARLWEAVIAHRKTVRRVIVASSMSVYGEGEYAEMQSTPGCAVVRAPERGWDAFDNVWPDGKCYPIVDPLTPQATRECKLPEPASVYALSKWDTERYSLMLGALYQVPTVALRFFNTYGPGQSLSNSYTGLMAIAACRVLNNRPIIVYEDGHQLRDFIHVSDVARAVVAAVERPANGAINVCTGRPTSVWGVAEAWLKIAAERGLPVPGIDVTRQYRKGDVRSCYGDPTLAKTLLGWEATTSLQDGLNDLADWLLSLPPEQRLPQDNAAQAETELHAHALLITP